MPNANEVLQHPVPIIAAFSVAEGMSFVGITTIYNHRELTHESLELTLAAQHTARIAMWMLGVQPRIWAQVHRVHHSVTDTNLIPAMEAANYLNWRRDHSAPGHPDIPRFIGGLDPGAILRPERIMEIGSFAEQLVSGRYDKPTDYSAAEAGRIINPITPRFYYQSRDEKKLTKLYDWEQPDLPERSLLRLSPELRDPHSGVLHILGVTGILKENVPRYKEGAEYFKRNEANGAEYGQDEWDRRIYDNVAAGMTAFYVGNSGIQITRNLLKGYFEKGRLDRNTVIKSVIRGGLEGSLVAVSADGILIGGGNGTNGAGHAGKLTGEGSGHGREFEHFARMLFSHQVTMNTDGSYTTDFTPFGWLSMDEAGRQREHHENPEWPAYTGQHGLRGVEQAPFGKSIEFMIKHGMLMKPGNQFGARDAAPYDVLPRRPDIRNEAVLLMQESRVETRDDKLSVV